MEYEKQDGNSFNIWKAEAIGTVIEGEVVAIREGDFGKQYEITDSEKVVFLTPSHKVLQARMDKAIIGTKVKIEYTGEELPTIKGQNPTKMYDVYFGKTE